MQLTNKKKLQAGWCLLLLVSVGFLGSVQASDYGLPQAESVLIKKAERKLLLLKGDKILKSFDIVLGRSPVGTKREEGDQRTPEGEYLLDWRNPYSRFYLSIHISYPNERDQLRARNLGVRPGGNIMIHGLPEERTKAASYYKTNDWTDGCIGVANSAMQEIWLAVADDTPVKIVP